MLPCVEAVTAREGYELWRPNRHKAQNKTTKAIVALVLVAWIAAGLVLCLKTFRWQSRG